MGRKPRKIKIVNGYVSAYDAARAERAFVESEKTAKEIVEDYGFPSINAFLFATRQERGPGKQDIRGM